MLEYIIELVGEDKVALSDLIKRMKLASADNYALTDRLWILAGNTAASALIDLG